MTPPSRSGDAVVFLSCLWAEVPLLRREDSVTVLGGLGGGESELPEEALPGAGQARPEHSPCSCN